MQIHNAVCDLCHHSHFKALFLGSDRLHGKPGDFWVLECEDCGLYSLYPQPNQDQIAEYYPNTYISFPKAIEDEKSLLRRLDRSYGLEKRCREIIRCAGKRGRILDVGCATGIFLNGMRQRGWICLGVEPSFYAVNYARERFHLEVYEGYLEDVEYPDEWFDAITMWDVLEHVPNQEQVLDKIGHLLKRDGWLVISLPNAESWERFIFQKYWAGWDVPRHFHIFTPKTITRLLESRGFKVEKIKSFTGRHGVLVLNFQFLITEWKVPIWVKRTILTIIRSLFARVLTYPYYMVADACNKSSIMTVFAKKI